MCCSDHRKCPKLCFAILWLQLSTIMCIGGRSIWKVGGPVMLEPRCQRSMEVGNGEGVSPHQPIRDLGECCRLLQRGPGRASAEIEFCNIWMLKKPSGGMFFILNTSLGLAGIQLVKLVLNVLYGFPRPLAVLSGRAQ